MSSDAEVIGGRYVLGPVIGRGAMAEVNSAEDLRLNRSVAIKLLLPSLAEQPDARLRFEEEARAAARLSDPNVVAIYDTGEHLGRPYIVMELFPGRTLRDELGDGPLGEARARAVIIHVLRALQAAHAAGVIHRDIKPGNILLTATGEAKVADFGIAKAEESSDLTATGLLVGSPSYLAPECVMGGTATVASDLYAVGVVLYESLSGQKPFTGDSPLAVCHAICTEAPPSLRDLRPDLSEEVVAVVTRAMAKDPQQRYRSASEMVQALDDESVDSVPALAIADEPTLAAVPIVDQTAPTPVLAVYDDVAVRRRSRFASAGAPALLLVALVAALVGVGLFLNARSHPADTTTDKQPVKTVTTLSASVTTTGPTTTRPAVTAAPITTSPTSAPATTAPTTSAPPTTTAPTTVAPTTTTPPTTTPPTTTAPPTSTAPPTTAASTLRPERG